MDIKKRVSITVANDNRIIEGFDGESLLEVLRRNNYMVPSLCYHPLLKPYGACRLCLVEVEDNGKRKLTTSCNYPLKQGIVVYLDTEKVKKNRKMVMELLLSRAPESGVLKQLAETLGLQGSRFIPENPDNCILCGLCVRACEEITERSAITFAYRGDRKKVVPPFNDLNWCIACGLCGKACPENAIVLERGLNLRDISPRILFEAEMVVCPSCGKKHISKRAHEKISEILGLEISTMYCDECRPKMIFETIYREVEGE